MLEETLNTRFVLVGEIATDIPFASGILVKNGAAELGISPQVLQ